MARIAGRSTWFAWFVGLVCAAVLGALVYLAAPLGPAVGDWTVRTVANAVGQITGDTGTSAVETGSQSGPDAVAGGPVMPADCTGLVSAELHQRLEGDAQAVMSIGAGEALAGVPGLAELLGAAPVLDCRWTTPAGSTAQAIVATVGDGAVGIADEMLRALGFDCTSVGEGVECTRTTAASEGVSGLIERHRVRGTVWVASVTTGWEPDGFADAVDAAVWPPA